MNQNFKNTKIGEIPEDWDVKKLGELSELMTNGFVGTATPFHTKSPDSVIYLQGYNIRANKIDLKNVTKVIHDFSNSQSKSILHENDILTVQSGHIGTTAVVPIHLEGSNCHALILTRFIENYVNSDFVAYYLNSDIGKANVKKITVGSTILHINVKDFKKFRIPFPTLAEQSQIAEILSTVDNAIEKTDAIIKETQQLKKGLMQKLFTEGIGHTRFKDTKIGRIPEEWNLLKLNELISGNKGSIKRGPFGGSIKKEFFVPKGFKVYEQKNVIYNNFDLGNYYIDDNKFEELQDFEVRPADLLVSCSGTIGKIVLVPKNIQRGVINQALLRITLNRNIMLPVFFKYLFESDAMQDRVISYTHGSAMKNIVSVKELKSINFVTPSIDEQKKIVEIITNVDRKIINEETTKFEFEELKKGLMQVLLTGKVRVEI
jgi:type I restriction enzyme S subunit